MSQKAKPSKPQKVRKKPATDDKPAAQSNAAYPRHDLSKVLRIPEAILVQNAGKDCSEKELAAFVKVGYGGPFRVEISSGIKFGLLDRPSAGQVSITDLARRALRPQHTGEDLQALREAVLNAPQISSVYEHYRGENLPDRKFFENALVDKFKVPPDKISDFIGIFERSLETAKLLQKIDDRIRVLDVTESISGNDDQRIRRKGKDVHVEPDDTCFVMMPFADPIGSYYQKIYEPAISKAGLKAVRADNEIFGVGKIMDQIWAGINSSRVLVAELTNRNPNVFYELGLAHALQKPVVLVAGKEEDVPFDLRHIRVIYYDMTDPFWGQKLLEKVAENVLSALQDPKEAILPRALELKA
jgi:hypothetical protein